MKKIFGLLTAFVLISSCVFSQVATDTVGSKYTNKYFGKNTETKDTAKVDSVTYNKGQIINSGIQTDMTAIGTIANYSLNKTTYEVRFANSASARIEGFENGVNGREIVCSNTSTGTDSIVLPNEALTSNPINRIKLPPGAPPTYALKAGYSILMRYQTNRWVVITTNFFSPIAGNVPIYPLTLMPFGDGVTQGGITSDSVNFDITQWRFYSSNINTNHGYQLRDDVILDGNTNASSVAVGFAANGLTANENTAVGRDAMASSTSGDKNSAFGWGALSANTTGYKNVAIGNSALIANTFGYCNIGIGYEAHDHITIGYMNVCLGNYGGAINAGLNNTIGIGHNCKIYYSHMGRFGGSSLNGTSTNKMTWAFGSGLVVPPSAQVHIQRDSSGTRLPLLLATDSTTAVADTFQLGDNKWNFVSDSARIHLPSSGPGKVLTEGADGYATWQTPSGGGSVTLNNSVYVAKNGNDGTGVRNDLGHPFLTINAAIAASNPYDVIVVYPGTYQETATINLSAKNNSFEFLGYGRLFTPSSGTALFSNSGSTSQNTIHAPKWTFTDDGDYELIFDISASSVVNVTVDSVISYETCMEIGSGFGIDTCKFTITADYIGSQEASSGTLYQLSGTVNIHCREIVNNAEGNTITVDRGSLYIDADRIINTSRSPSHPAIKTDNTDSADVVFIQANYIYSDTGTAWTCYFQGESKFNYLRAQRVEGWGSCNVVAGDQTKVIAQVDEIYNRRRGGTPKPAPRGLYNAEAQAQLFAIGTHMRMDTSAGTWLYGANTGVLSVQGMHVTPDRINMTGSSVLHTLDNYFNDSVWVRGKLQYQDGTQGANKILTSDASGNASWATPTTIPPDTVAIEYVIDGGGSTITTGIKGDIEVPFGCTILRATLLADQSGSIVVQIWKDIYANYPPDVSDAIYGAAPPTISSAVKSQDATLTGWTTSIASGSTLRFNVSSVTSIQRCTVSLKCIKN